MSKTKILQKENQSPISDYYTNSETKEPYTSEETLKKYQDS